MKSVSRHITEIKSGGWPIAQQKIQALFQKAVVILCGIWALPVIILVRLLKPWRTIRFGSISCNRIGPFVNEAGYKWVMTKHIRPEKKYIDIYWFRNDPICNEFWARLVRRAFIVSPFARILDHWNHIVPGGELHSIPTDLTKEYPDIREWVGKSRTSIPFLPDEDKKAKAWLKNLGWKEGEPFVCLLVRDSSYLNSTFQNTDPPPAEDGIKYDAKTGYGWNHLNFRDSDIETYVPAAEWLANQGVWVLRMGKVMEKPIPSRHSRIIDYAFHPEKSDFLDIWLFSHCYLCVSTGAGIDEVSDIYRRPIIYLNFLPIWRVSSTSQVMHVPKTLVWKDSGIPLNFREYCNCHVNYYERFGIRIVNLTPDEILQSVQECWQRLHGTWKDTDDDIMRQQRFWDLLKMHPEYFLHHSWIHPESRIGTLWLRSKGDSFLK